VWQFNDKHIDFSLKQAAIFETADGTTKAQWNVAVFSTEVQSGLILC
jgi:hypothetical protein